MRFLRILPAVCAMISWPFSSVTRKVALGRSSLTVPGNSRSSSFAIRPLAVVWRAGECTETSEKQGKGRFETDSGGLRTACPGRKQPPALRRPDSGGPSVRWESVSAGNQVFLVAAARGKQRSLRVIGAKRLEPYP